MFINNLYINYNLGCHNNDYGKLPHNYTGTIASTTAGYDCTNWSSNNLNILNVIQIDDHNYCRSHNNQSLGAWCYTTEPTILWQYCSCPVKTPSKIT